MRGVDALVAMQASPKLSIYLTANTKYTKVTKATYTVCGLGAIYGTYSERSKALQGQDTWNDGPSLTADAWLQPRLRLNSRIASARLPACCLAPTTPQGVITASL